MGPVSERTSPTGEPEDDGVSAEGHRRPAWVKAFLLVALLGLVAIALVLLLGGDHGPARHAPTAAVAELFDSQLARPAAILSTPSLWSA